MDTAPIIITLFALTAAISWGVADFFAAKASIRKSPEITALFTSIIAVFIYVFIFAINSGQLQWNLSGILFATAAGVCIELGLLSFFRGLASGPVSIVTPISSAFPIITTALVVIFFNETLQLLDLVGIVIVVIGIIVASGVLELRNNSQKVSKGVRYALITLSLWGVGFVFLGEAIDRIGWEKSYLVDLLAGLLAITVYLTLTTGKKAWRNMSLEGFKDRYIIGASVLQLFGGLIFSIGLSRASSTAVITAISASYPAFTIFLALKYLGEKKIFVPLAGAFVTIFGVIILSI